MKNEITANSPKSAFITVNNQRPTYKNANLEKATAAIESTWTKAQESILKTARTTKMKIYEQAAKVEANGCYKDDGFKDSAAWLEAAFGVKYSTAKAYIQIGKEIIAGNIPRNIDLGIDALRMLSGKGVDAKKLIESGEVKSGMSKAEVAKAVEAGKEATQTEGDIEKKVEPKPEKVYNWKCVSANVPDHISTESAFASASYEWTKRVKVDAGVFFMCAKNGGIIVYQRMTEVVEAEQEAAAEATEAEQEATAE